MVSRSSAVFKVTFLLFLMMGMVVDITEVLAKIPEICTRDKGAYIARCAKTCALACQNRDFKYKSDSIYEKCRTLSKNAANKRKEPSICTRPPMKNACLDRVESMDPYSKRVEREIAAATTKVEEIQRMPDLSDEEKTMLIDEYKKDVEKVGTFYDGFDKWKCSGLTTPSAREVKISSPEALGVFYDECLKGAMDTRVTEYDILAKNYASLSSKSDVCILVKKFGKKKLDKDKFKARLLRLRVRSLKKHFVKANVCLQSIVAWNDGAIDKCKDSLNCKAWQDKAAAGLKQKLSTIKQFQAAVSLKLKGLPNQIKNIEDLLLQSVRCGIQ